MSKRGRKRDPARLQHDTTLFAVISSGEQDPMRGLVENEQKFRQLLEASREADIEPGRLYFGEKEVPSFKSARQAAAWLAEEWDVAGACPRPSLKAWSSISKRKRTAGQIPGDR